MKQPIVALIGVAILGGVSGVFGDDYCSRCHWVSSSSYSGGSFYSAALRRYHSEVYSSAYNREVSSYSSVVRRYSITPLADCKPRIIGGDSLDDSSPSDALRSSELLRRSHEILAESSELLRRIRNSNASLYEAYASEFPDYSEFDTEGSFYRSIDASPYLYRYRYLGARDSAGYRILREFPSTSGGLYDYESRPAPSRGSYPSTIIP